MLSSGNLPMDTCLFLPYIDSMLVYFKDTTPESDVQQFQSQINKYGYSVRGSEILQATKKEADYQFRKDFFVFYSLSGLVLVSLITVSFLNAKRLTRKIAIYYLNGCSNRRAVFIYLSYFTWLNILSFGIYWTAISLQHLQMSLSSELIDNVRSYTYVADPQTAAVLGGLFLLQVCYSV